MLTMHHKKKIGPTRPDLKAWKEHYLTPPSPESQPPTPRSVRPPLPSDIDAELKAACTYIITHPKPSHELWPQEAARPALDYAAVKAGGVAGAGLVPVRTRSTRQYRAEPSRMDLLDSTKYAYKPHVAIEDLFTGESQRTGAQSNARSRADMLMSGEGTRQPPSMTHSRQRSEPTNQSLPYSANTNDNVEKSRMPATSGSGGTSGSTPHTDSTDYPWSASTGLTSAAITPARSKRTSSQAVASGSDSGSAPKVEAVNAEWMRLELEKHKTAMAEKEREKENLTRARPPFPTRGSSQSPVTMSSMSQVPARKPVPSSRPASRQATDNSRQGMRSSDQDCIHPTERGRVDSHQQDSSLKVRDVEGRGRATDRSNSLARNASRAASRVADEAKSVTQDILGHYFRPPSDQENTDLNERPPSRARQLAYSVKTYFRPGSAAGSRSRNASVDVNRGHARGPSFDSSRSIMSATAPSERSSRWKNYWRPGRPNGSVDRYGDIGRSDSPASQLPLQHKPAIDLNRELPPLPSLDSWKDDVQEETSPTPAVQEPRSRPTPPPGSMANGIAPAFRGLRRALSRNNVRQGPSGEISTREDIVAARMGAPSPPTPAGSSSMNSPSIAHGSSNLSVSHSTDPDNVSSKSGGKLRELTNKISQPTLRRKASSDSQSIAQSMSEQEKRRMPHIADYSRKTGPPLSGTSRVWHKAGMVAAGSESSVYGHSRDNSDVTYSSHKYSTDTDNWSAYQNSVPIQLQQDAGSEKVKKHWWRGREKTKDDGSAVVRF